MDQMVEFEKKPKEKTTRVYTYENAVERCYTFLLCCFRITPHQLIHVFSKNVFYLFQVAGCKPHTV